MRDRMDVTVVGGAGFIGRHVVRRLAILGHTVRTIDRQAPEDPQAGERAFAIDVGQERGAEEAAAATRGSDRLIWLAATIRQTSRVDLGALEDLRVMVEAPLRLLAALPSPPAGVVYASSIQVYGRPERLPVDEDHPTRPFTAYGVAKLCGETYLRVACGAMGIPIALLRLAFVYGPGQHPGNVIPLWLRALRQGEAPLVHGTGLGVRDDVYVEDVARSITLALEAGAHGTFNIAGGRPHTLLDVARAACRVAGSPAEPRHDDLDPAWVDRWYSIDRARRAIGFEPQVTLEDGLRRTWEAL
ncbi:MAG: NAD-dependent epimerase/dehydratase family protein [Candidatus Polarisedimenticolia bacterium]